MSFATATAFSKSKVLFSLLQSFNSTDWLFKGTYGKLAIWKYGSFLRVIWTLKPCDEALFVWRQRGKMGEEDSSGAEANLALWHQWWWMKTERRWQLDKGSTKKMVFLGILLKSKIKEGGSGNPKLYGKFWWPLFLALKTQYQFLSDPSLIIGNPCQLNCVDNNLFQICKLRFGHKAKLLFRP